MRCGRAAPPGPLHKGLDCESQVESLAGPVSDGGCWGDADIESACKTLKARGVEFSNVPHMIFRHADGTEEWMAFFKDPEGRPLALMEQVAQLSSPA